MNGEIVPRLDQLLLPILQLNFAAQGVDVGGRARFNLICCLVKKRLGRLDLSFIGRNPSFVGNSLKVNVPNREDNEVIASRKV